MARTCSGCNRIMGRHATGTMCGACVHGSAPKPRCADCGNQAPLDRTGKWCANCLAGRIAHANYVKPSGYVGQTHNEMRARGAREHAPCDLQGAIEMGNVED